jgi:cytochrome b561
MYDCQNQYLILCFRGPGKAVRGKAALNATRIYAPLSGTVMSVDAQLGDAVSTSVIMVVADLNKLYLKTYVDESDYGMFKIGLHVLAALYHQFIRRDNLLARMWYGKEGPATNTKISR